VRYRDAARAGLADASAAADVIFSSVRRERGETVLVLSCVLAIAEAR
jgi:hypothetical protein